LENLYLIQKKSINTYLQYSNLNHNIIPEDECIVYEASWSDMIKSIKIFSKTDITVYERVNKLKRIKLFANLSDLKLFQLAKVLEKVDYEHNDLIIKEGTLGDKFFIINSGKVKVFKDYILLRELEAFSCFGEVCFGKESQYRNASIYANGPVECYTLNYQSFTEIVDEKVTEHIQKAISLQDMTIELTSLYYLKVLGHGKFGRVYLVHNTKNFYAIKSARIQDVCSKPDLIQYFINEKNIMKQLDHPFLVKFVKTLKDKHYLYFLLEYVDGIPLKNFLEKRKIHEMKNVNHTKFYGGILFCAINYLHKKKIIHRDIKPDNCMIGINGYLKLIDFGVSKDLTETGRTLTMVGTPHYIAPEILLGKGYGFSADYWSICVLMFEIFYGYYPFGNNSNDVMDIYKNILGK
jgi:cGMP-dependent protein kinase